MAMAVRVPEIDYYSLHGIWGAYASLVLGRIGKGAGVVVGDVRPPDRGLFVGYRIGNDEPRLLPFASGKDIAAGASAYHADEDMPATCHISGLKKWSAGFLFQAKNGAQALCPFV